MWPRQWGGSSTDGGAVSDRIALTLAALILGLVVADVLANGGDVLLFLGRKFTDLLEYVIFWR